MAPQPSSRPHDASTLRRGLEILHKLAKAPSGSLGVAELARIIDCEKSQVSRTLRTLDSLGYVEKDTDHRKYRLGWALHAFGNTATHLRLLNVAHSVVKAVSMQSGELTHLCALQGTEVLTLQAETPSERRIRVGEWIGSTVPADRTATGRVLLSDHSSRSVEALFNSRLLSVGEAGISTDTTIEELDVEQLNRDLLDAQRQGYAIVRDELEEGLLAIAAPIRGQMGRIMACIGVAGPTGRMDPVVTTMVPLIKRAAISIEKAYYT